MAYTAWSVVFGEQPTAAKWNQLGENDAGFRDGTNIDDDFLALRHIPDGLLNYTKLLSTIFSGQIQSQINSGDGGGNMYYLNIGGLKLLWGKTALSGSASGQTNKYVILPTGFFTTVYTALETITDLTGTGDQFHFVNTLSTSQLYLSAGSAGSSNRAWFYFVIGV